MEDKSAKQLLWVVVVVVVAAASFPQMNTMPIGHRSDHCDLAQMTPLPTKNHYSIIQTCVEEEPGCRDIKINEKRGRRKKKKGEGYKCSTLFEQSLPTYMQRELHEPEEQPRRHLILRTVRARMESGFIF